MLSNAHSGKECLADVKLLGRLRNSARQAPLCLEGIPRIGLASSAVLGGPMTDLSSTQWSCIAAGEDARAQTWHTNVAKLPGTLPSKGELPNHLCMMLVLLDRCQLEVRLGSLLGEHDPVRIQCLEF